MFSPAHRIFPRSNLPNYRSRTRSQVVRRFLHVVSLRATMTMGKIFVGGLSRDTDDDRLRKYFSKFGEVLIAKVKTDPSTKRSRDSTVVSKVLADESWHVLDNKRIDPKAAVGRGTSSASKPKATQSGPFVGRVKKIFIGGVASWTTKTDIMDYFSTYGKVAEIILASDQGTQKRRGFGFVTFDKEEAVDKIVDEKYHRINGKTVEAKKAIPRPGRDNEDGTSKSLDKSSIGGTKEGQIFPPALAPGHVVYAAAPPAPPAPPPVYVSPDVVYGDLPSGLSCDCKTAGPPVYVSPDVVYGGLPSGLSCDCKLQVLGAPSSTHAAVVQRQQMIMPSPGMGAIVQRQSQPLSPLLHDHGGTCMQPPHTTQTNSGVCFVSRLR
ncbi:RNA-binding protein Musashi homolog 2-like isoform X2 [Oscarella lobularis]|uniref:RNA-binding protein Musashi homolog 2-like isoform X2 n=1 Tax=Oscarella lobularis TaxID=121494 RepID=UPI0033130E81